MPRPHELSKSLLKHLAGYLGGQFLPEGDTALTVVNPATEQVLASLPLYGSPETQQAVAYAQEALARPTTLEQRRQWLLQIAAAHSHHREALAQIITAENGKPLAESRGEVDYAASFYSHAASQINCLKPRLLPTGPGELRWTVFSRPAGVAGLIVPWNFPLSMLAKKAAAALAAGAPIVVKPSEKTPLSSIALFHIFHELNLPPGQVNLVFGDAPAIGKVLCEHPAVRVISFTGSTAVGKQLSLQAAPYIKRMALELGGSAPFLVFDEADLPLALDQLMANKFRCAGQTCVCTNRVYVQQGVAKKFLQLLTERVAALSVGPGCKKQSQVGPLIERSAVQKVNHWVQRALAAGAQRSEFGEKRNLPKFGFFCSPAVLDCGSSAPSCLSEEVFGPIVPVVSFATEADAIREANNSDYGLAAYVFTRNVGQGQRVVAKLSFGHVGLNTASGPMAGAPFGGMKQSGLGREGGQEGLLEFVELQTVPQGLP